MNVETSRAQAENPLRNVAVDVMSVPAASLPRALRSRRWRTVTSSTSAFSNLCIPSPLLHPVASIKSLSSSRQELILALLFLSSIGFRTFLYWWVLLIELSRGAASISGEDCDEIPESSSDTFKGLSALTWCFRSLSSQG